ncbi:MAG: hypothetical protein V1792_24860 [Pseudomonadota bacterium]
MNPEAGAEGGGRVVGRQSGRESALPDRDPQYYLEAAALFEALSGLIFWVCSAALRSR